MSTEVRGMERVKWATLVCIAILLAALIWILYRRLTPEPPTPEAAVTIHYFPLSGDVDLFVVATGANDAEIRSGAVDCKPDGGGARQFVVQPGKTFRCGNALMKLYSDVGSSTLVLTGFDDVALPAVVGSGHRLKRDDGLARFVFAGPGVGVDHLRLLHATDCPAPVPADGLACVENGGATGSLLVFPEQGQPASLGHGDRVPVRSGAQLWLGFVPMTLTRTATGLVRLEVANGSKNEGWREIAGNRLWMGLELPAWTLSQPKVVAAPRVVHAFRPESLEFSPGNLSPSRVEPEQEEEIQLLVDHEVLCVDGVTRLQSKPVLAMRDPSRPGCSDVDGTRRNVAPLTSEAAAAVRAAMGDPRIRALLAAEGGRLGGKTSRQDDRESILLFDHRRLFTAVPNPTLGQSKNAPVAVLGIRPRTTLYRVTPPPRAEEEPTIRFAASTSSAVLEVLDGPQQIAVPPLLQLVQSALPMYVCEGVGFTAGVTKPRARRGTLPLGTVSFTGQDVTWAEAGPSPMPAGCVSLRRNGLAIELSAASFRGAAVLRNGNPVQLTQSVRLVDGDELRLAATHFRFRDGDLPAATTYRSARRYPYEGDAAQLLGLGALSAGIEGTLDRNFKQRLARAVSLPGRELRLTIDGDLQRLVSRTLATAIRHGIKTAEEKKNVGGNIEARVQTMFDDLRAAALLMDAEDGRILAVATLPRFDPWRIADHGQLLARMKVGSSTSEEKQRYEEQRYIENYAFRRAAEIGSTQKIATSIALARAGRLVSNVATASSCANKMEIRYGASINAKTSLKCDKIARHDVLTGGAPSWPAWRHAFEGSCNIYFALAAASLVPKINIASTTAENGGSPVFTFPASLDPSVDFLPADLANPGQGNGFFETAMLLGYRFEFRGAGVKVQTAESYNNIPYPTSQRPWLEGLAPRAFRYPTMPAAETFSNTFHKNNLWPGKKSIVGGVPVVGTEFMRNYLLLGFGQNLTGSPLSMTTMTTPILSSTGTVATPTLIQNASMTTHFPAPRLLPDDSVRTILRDGLESVIRSGTGADYFGDVTFPQGVRIGGKTGTITIEAIEPPTNVNDVYERAFEYGCGTIGASIDASDWTKIAGEAGVASPRTPPAWGFAGGTTSCARRNPGLPRISGTLTASDEQVWTYLLERVDGQRDERKVASSAFVAAMWPASAASNLPPETEKDLPHRNALNVTLPHPLVLAVVADHHDRAAKFAAADIASEVLALLAMRRERP